jgi:pimeloyl-ACP methyl ester carboxylesterase
MATSTGPTRDTAFAEKVRPFSLDFMTVDETRLRYLDVGTGRPVVLLHGNGSMIEDFTCSGVMDVPGYRFVAFDRPGFGYSERPRDRVWGPFEQASLMMRALARLGVERPIVVGHSWGTLVALAMALQRPLDVAGLVLLSGYFYPVSRTGAAVRAGAFPFAHMVRRLMAPITLHRVFAPCPIPEKFKRMYPLLLALRTSHMRAVDEEAAMLPDAAKTLCRLYERLSVPVQIIAGSSDLVVNTEDHSARLHDELGTSTFRSIPECGHMVHHAAPSTVVGAIAALDSGRPRKKARPQAMESVAVPGRDWLQLAA